MNGETVTVRATEEQAVLLKQWIGNARQLNKILAEMQRVSQCITEPLFAAARKPPRGS